MINIRKKVVSFLKRVNLYYSVIIFKDSIWYFPKIVFSFIASFLPKKNNKIVISSFYGEQYNAEPKMISDRLLESYSGFNIVWIYNGIIDDKRIKTVKYLSYRCLYELATASVWVDNCRKPFWIKKNKKQLYIQTWHGAVCIKAVEKDAIDGLSPTYIKNARSDSDKANYIVSEAEWRTNNIKKAFWYNGDIIKASFYPGNNDVQDKVYNYFDIPKDYSIALYVPTFRNDHSLDYYIKDYKKILNSIESSFGGKWIFIIRLHPNIANNANSFTYDDNLKNGTDYSSVDELIVSSDLIISDYSGCLFDSFYYNKKVFIYANDLDKYMNNERKLYFDIRKLPAPVSQNEEELINAISSYDCIKYSSMGKKFVKKLGFYSTHADKLCCELIDKHIIGYNEGY